MNDCKCPIPCGGKVTSQDERALIYLLLVQTPPFSGSCELQNDCIDFKNATQETLHINICDSQGGIYKRNISCDLSGKSAECSLLKETSLFRLKYYYGSSWNATDATEHCQTDLKGLYSNL